MLHAVIDAEGHLRGQAVVGRVDGGADDGRVFRVDQDLPADDAEDAVPPQVFGGRVRDPVEFAAPHDSP